MREPPKLKRHEAENRAEEDQWQCRTCSAPMDEVPEDGYCRSCRDYWNDTIGW